MFFDFPFVSPLTRYEVTAMAKKKEAAAAAKPAEVPEEVPHEEEHDKVQSVLNEIKKKSSEIVVRLQFQKPLDASLPPAEAIRLRLDDTLGLDGWGQEYKPVGMNGLLCGLHVCIADDWVYRTGIGFGGVAESSEAQKFVKAAENAFIDAARQFGIGRDVIPVTKGESPKAAPAAEKVTKPAPAAAAKPADLTPEAKKAKIEELKKFWSTKLCECETAEDLNEMIRGSEVKAIPAYAKGDVFVFIKEQAKEVGWNYDKETMTFFQPKKEDEPADSIPF